jgi:hypothetical protein
LIARYLVFWLVLAIIAVANGILREFTYGPYLSNLAAHQVSTVTAIVLIGGAVWTLSRFWPIGSRKETWIIGACWLLMTIAFEFGFGHYVAGHSWSRLLAGSLFLVWVAVLPYVIWRLGKV